MSKIYAWVVEGVVHEMIPPFTNENGEEVPVADRYAALMVEDFIEADGGVKVGYTWNGSTFNPPVKAVEVITRDEVESLRLIAYANPVSGSDRYFAEAMSLQAEGFAANSTEVKETKARGIARKTEIKELYPYPSE
ncbi:hypothetical protein D9M71_262740 [compost metagenome]